MKRVHNFSAGPAALPLEVLMKAQKELPDYHGTGTSIMEKSHRGPEYTRIDTEARERLTDILGLSDEFSIMFLQGGASTQFFTVPQNFLYPGQTADYINTGAWADKAIKEAELFGSVNVAFSSKESNFDRVPKSDELNLTPEARYVHYTSNNTIFGTQFETEPETGTVSLVCDASSDFLSRPLELDRYGLIYAGAQKNLGPAGVTIVIVRKSFLEQSKSSGVPTMVSYRSHADKIYNTPPAYSVYMVNLVLQWIQEKGGLSYFKQFNAEKAELLYNEIDRDSFYRGTAELESRSEMNVTFRLPTEELENKFIKEAAEKNLVALKGHRSVGGIRASIYNACPVESVEALTSFMADFRSANG